MGIEYEMPIGDPPPAASPAGGPAPLTEEDGERSAQSLDAAGWHREAALLRRLLTVAAHHRAEGPDLAAARETIRRLNRRCQEYERGLTEKLEVAARSGGSLGRGLANAAASMYLARAERAEAALRRIADDENDGRRDFAGVTAEHYRTLAKFALAGPPGGGPA